jgi:hypothetical protein
MTSAEIVTLVVAILAHGSAFAALWHSVQTRKSVTK